MIPGYSLLSKSIPPASENPNVVNPPEDGMSEENMTYKKNLQTANYVSIKEYFSLSKF